MLQKSDRPEVTGGGGGKNLPMGEQMGGRPHFYETLTQFVIRITFAVLFWECELPVVSLDNS